MTVTKNETQVLNLPKVFTFNPTNQPVRVEVINNQNWFVAKDICDVLDIKWQGDKTLENIPPEWKGSGKLPTPGGIQEFILINEAGMYKFVFRSNKPTADKFTNWVASDVLPSIRRTGKYEQTPEPKALPAKRNHNRITKERMVSILADVCRIDNSELRMSLTTKLMGGHTV